MLVAVGLGRRGGDGGVVGVEGRAGGRKGRSDGAVVDAVHVLVRRHGARDLEELGKHQHGDPEELERYPH